MIRFHQQVSERLTSLSRAERQVGEWLLANLTTAADISLGEVADAAGVSEPTVIRFCRSIGLKGFRDLRTAISAAIQQPENYVHQAVAPTDSSQRAASKVLESTIHALVDLRSTVDQQPFEEAATRIATARQLVFVGMGASGIVAEDARHKFFRLGIPSTSATDPQSIVQQASVLTEQDVFVLISHTGNWPELIQAASLSAEHGAVNIGITSTGSRLAEHVDLLFLCSAREDTEAFTPMTSRLEQLAVLDALQISAALKIGAVAETQLKNSKAALSDYRDYREDGMQQADGP